MRIKYVVLECTVGIMQMEIPFIFPEFADHSTITQGQKVLSAGFLNIDYVNKKCHPWGKSVTLDLTPKPGDEKLLEGLIFAEEF